MLAGSRHSGVTQRELATEESQGDEGGAASFRGSLRPKNLRMTAESLAAKASAFYAVLSAHRLT